jgi:glycosyltransferase involved in cell wall biosynthesis
MEKYSVIIPTLWKSNRTKKLISDLESCEYVDEIIIIDNTLTEPTDTTIGKIRTYSFGQNIYVNPAWNAGVFFAKNNCIALINDDINFNPIIFKLINKQTLIDFGFIGMAADNYSDKVDKSKDVYIEELLPTDSEWGWGCMLLFYKEYWINIPHDIKIWYGDNCIKEMNPVTKSVLRNFKIETEMSTTSDESQWDEIKKNDEISFARYYSFLAETFRLLDKLKM